MLFATGVALLVLDQTHGTIVGLHKAKELAFTAKMLSGAEAHDLGLVNAVVPRDELDAAALALAQDIAKNEPFVVQLQAMPRMLQPASEQIESLHA